MHTDMWMFSLTSLSQHYAVLFVCDRMCHKRLTLLLRVFIQTFESVCCVEYKYVASLCHILSID